MSGTSLWGVKREGVSVGPNGRHRAEEGGGLCALHLIND